MSDTQHGAGWWQASDGRWYPPPAASPPPGSAYPPYAPAYAAPQGPGYYTPPPGAKTNGLAIASFVLSLVWFVGLGSLLAVIFSLVARKQIKDSRGTQGGGGLAIAGLVIGILGMAGSLLFIILLAVTGQAINQLSQQLRQAGTPTYLQMGETAKVGDSAETGIARVTVESLTIPYTAYPAYSAPSVGKEYAVANIQVCAGTAGSQSGPNTFDFSLVFPGDVTVAPSFPVASPDLGSVNGLTSNGCATGYITFQVATGTTPSYVAYQPGLVHQYRWRVPG